MPKNARLASKVSDFVLNSQSPDIPEEDLHKAGQRFGQSTFYETENLPIGRPYSPPFAGATPLPKSGGPLKIKSKPPKIPPMKKAPTSLERVTTDLLKKADELLGVDFDLEKQCYVDRKTNQVYSLYE